MKRIIFTTLAFICLTATAFAAGPDSYQCIRPDGTVVCTINAPSGAPSVVCNHDCIDCNLTCTAQQVVVRDGNELLFNPGAPAAVRPKQSGPGISETPENCRRQYQQCESQCRANPNNRTQYDMDACISNCKSTFTGCGTMR